MNSPFQLDPWIGRSIGDRQRYRLEQSLGGGGMGNVFLAMDTLLGQHVALKLLKETLVASEELRKRFKREVAVCAALKSDHIVQVNDYGVTPEGHPFYVMEYLRGQSLGQLLRHEKRLSTERSISIIIQICEGLRLAHEGVTLWRDNATASEHVQVIHRDLKPDNIFLVPTALGDLVKILDFGIAKICDESSEYTNLTNMFVGTFHYAAPEQLGVEKGLDRRADIYSLGMILYEMLSGTDPFGLGFNVQFISGSSWVLAHTSKPPEPLRLQPGCKHLLPELEAVVMRCLRKAPEERFASVDDLHRALKTVVTVDSKVSSTSIPQQRTSTERGAIEVTSAETSPALEQDSSKQTFHQKEITPETVTGIDQVACHPPQKGSSDVTVTRLPHSSNLCSDSTISKPLTSTLNNSPSKTKSPLLVIGSGLSIALALTFGIVYCWQWSSKPPKSELAFQRPSFSLINTLAGHSGSVWSVIVSPDGQSLVSGSEDKTIKIWRLSTGELLRALSKHSDAVRALAISSDGTILASGSGDKTIKIWRLSTGELLRTLSGHSGAVWSIAISPDKQILVSSSYDGTIKLWNLSTGKLLRTLSGHSGVVWSIAINPDGQTFASSSQDKTIKIWRLSTGELLRTLSGHSDTVRDIAISSDGQTLASGSWDQTIKIWNLHSGKLLRTLSGHTSRVISIAFSSDEQALASSSQDKTIKIWRTDVGELIYTLSSTHSDWVLSVAVSSDKQTLISGSKDQTIKIWRRQ